MKNKFINKIDGVYSDIQSVSKDLFSDSNLFNTTDRVDKIAIGNKMILFIELNTKLFSYIELYRELFDSFEGLSDDVVKYYNDIEEFKKPPSTMDSEEVKKIKELINNYKKGEI